MNPNIQTLKQKIVEGSSFLLINHIRMDPDAFGSLGAFYLLLEKLAKTVKATNDELSPPNYSFLASKSFFEPHISIDVLKPDVVISFDAASEDQLGETYLSQKLAFQSSQFFVIDHHVSNPGFGKYNIIDSASSSSCELVYEIICEMGWQEHIDADIATLLLAGIHTDTNTFYNKNTTPKTLKIAAELLEKGARNREIIFEFYRKRTFEQAKLWGKVLTNMQKTPDGKVVWVSVSKNQFSDLSIGDQGLKGLLNEFLANIDGADVAILLYEIGNGEVKGSLRSNSDAIDVAKICGEFGGGGHKLAAGFTVADSLGNIEKILLEKIKPFLK